MSHVTRSFAFPCSRNDRFTAYDFLRGYQSSTVKKVKIFDLESKAEFIRALVLRFANTITYPNDYNL